MKTIKLTLGKQVIECEVDFATWAASRGKELTLYVHAHFPAEIDANTTMLFNDPDEFTGRLVVKSVGPKAGQARLQSSGAFTLPFDVRKSLAINGAIV